MTTTHVITAIVEGQQISEWQSGNFESSIITPADSFVLRMPFSRAVWLAMRTDARVKILVDGTPMLTGFVDKRIRFGPKGVLEVSGRDLVGRLVDESAPAIKYSGMKAKDAIERLADPWFHEVSIDGSRNRRLRRGKGKRVASGTEDPVTINVRVPRRGTVHPGETRWQLIHEIASRLGLIAYSSSDGKELIVGKPNQTQTPQYTFTLAAPGSAMLTNVRELTITEDSGDRFSLYRCGGVGGQTDTNFGKGVQNNGVVFDNPFNRIDGTGRDFIHPKRMYLPERTFESYRDAQRVAQNEQARRDMKRHAISIEAATFGQNLGTSDPTLFAPDTIARVVDEEVGLDDKYLVTACSYSFNRDNGDRTTLHMVPVGTEIIL